MPNQQNSAYETLCGECEHPRLLHGNSMDKIGSGIQKKVDDSRCEYTNCKCESYRSNQSIKGFPVSKDKRCPECQNVDVYDTGNRTVLHASKLVNGRYSQPDIPLYRCAKCEKMFRYIP